MANDSDDQHDSVGAWAKKYYYANRAAIEAILRPFDLGWTQWAVLYQLVNDGPSIQRDLGHTLGVERASLSTVVAALVRKGLVEQRSHSSDQRQRVLELTTAGRELWAVLPDPVGASLAISFHDEDPADLATAIAVLKRGTERLASAGNSPLAGGSGRRPQPR
ncbi:MULTISPECIES: MarR family winged helix-turn-helix transcriptional regulator [Streptomyces]|uniref:MarR family winged helix-turn-helix transcriptional regulator n=1 Tax=Streptomyces TaxID=1883 RepID=UPI002FDC71D3